MAILTNTLVQGNIRNNGLISTDALAINGYAAAILDPSSTIVGNETSAKLVSAKQVVAYIQSKRITPSRSDNTVSWGTGWVEAGSSTGSLSNGTATTLNAGGSITISKGWVSSAFTVSAKSLASQTGVDSGKTAAGAGQILTGYQAWVNGNKVTGNMTARSYTDVTGVASTSYTNRAISVPSGGYLSIPPGYYADGIAISLANLIPDISSNAAAGHILSGKKAYDEAGNVITGTIGTVTFPSTSATISAQGGTASITLGAGYHASEETYTVTATLSGGTVTANTTLPSGSSAESTETTAGNYVKVGAGYYASDKYYKAKTLASQTGVDSGKTAAGQGQILTGYQAWVNGSKVSGNMPNNSGNVTLTMSEGTSNYSGSYTVPTGYYAANARVVSASVPYATFEVSGASVKSKSNGAGYVKAGTTVGTIGNVSGTIGGSASAGSCSAAIANTDNMRTISSASGTAGTDYFRVKATATGNAGSYTPKYTVNTAGYISSTVTGTAQTVSVSSDSTGKTIMVPKAAFTTSGASVKTTSAGGGYVKDNTTVGTISSGSVTVPKGSISGNDITASISWTGINYTISGSTTVTHAHGTITNTDGYVTSSNISSTGGATKTVSCSKTGSNSLTLSVNSGQTLTISSNAGTTNINGNSGTIKIVDWNITKDSNNNLVFTYAG